jgi:hypothetical protein
MDILKLSKKFLKPQWTYCILFSLLLTNRRELKLLFFISPILLYVAELFGPEDSMKIVVEEVNFKASGHFEFMLKRNNKRLCIVEAKKDDMDKEWLRI